MLLDPFDETERSADDMDALDLFARLAVGGFPTVMWHGFDDIVGRDAIRARGVVDGVATHTLDIETAFLRGETTLSPGVGGCGMLLANSPTTSWITSRRLGRQLEALLRPGAHARRHARRLRFTRIDLRLTLATLPAGIELEPTDAISRS